MEKIWTRMKGEQSKGYGLFCIYKDLGPNRTLKKVVEKSKTIKQSPKSTIYGIQKYSSKWNWTERAAAYDDHLNEKFRKENEKRIMQMRREQAEEARGIRSFVIELKKEFAKIENVKITSFKTLGSLAWFMEKLMNIYSTACMIEQDALGEADATVDKEKRRMEFVKIFAEIHNAGNDRKDGKDDSK